MFGNALQMNRETMYKSFTTWEAEHGKCYKINLFGREALVLSSEKALHEALVKKGKDFAGRNTASGRFKLADICQTITTLPPNKEWKELRRACHQSVRINL